MKLNPHCIDCTHFGFGCEGIREEKFYGNPEYGEAIGKPDCWEKDYLNNCHDGQGECNPAGCYEAADCGPQG